MTLKCLPHSNFLHISTRWWRRRKLKAIYIVFANVGCNKEKNYQPFVLKTDSFSQLFVVGAGLFHWKHKQLGGGGGQGLRLN